MTMMQNKRRLLVVDDDASVVDYLVEMLNEHGFVTHGVTSPIDALARMEQAEYDLVIADIEMPGMRGLDLMAEVPNAETALAIAGIGSVAGLAVGATLTQNYDDGKDLSLETTRTEETRWSFAPKAVRDPETGRTVPGMGVRVSSLPHWHD